VKISNTKKIGKITYYSIIAGIVLVPISIILSYWFESYLDTLSQRYCYENFLTNNNQPVDNMVLTIHDLKYKNEYIEYYKKVKKGLNPKFNFPIITPPLGGKVYVKGFTEDSSLVEIFIRERFDRAKFLFYVIPEALHDNPPNLTGRYIIHLK